MWGTSPRRMGSWRETGTSTLRAQCEQTRGQALRGLRAIEEYWDVSSEAGPPHRPRATFDVEAPTLDVCASGAEGLTHLGNSMLAVGSVAV